MSHRTDNLIPEAHKLTAEDRQKAGKASAESRRKKRDLRLAIEALLEKDFTDKKGNTGTGTEVLAAKLFEKAMSGDVKAFEVLRDTAGQKPVDKVVYAEIDPDVIEEVEALVEEDDEADEETGD